MIFVLVEESSINKQQKKTLALAGVAQAASLVYELANHGNCEATAFSTSIHSIYKIDSDTVSEIYGDTTNLNLGLNKLIELLSYSKQSTYKDMMRYFISILTLERKLMQDKKSLTLLRERLDIILTQVGYFSPLHETVLENLDNLYSDVLGQFNLRIIVTGKPEYLQANDVIYKVRALLLAGIRSAVLWRQMGGTRLQLILQRSKLVSTSQALLAI